MYLLLYKAVKYLEPQMRLAAKAGKTKKEYKLSMISDTTLEKVRNLAEAPIEAVFTDPSYGKVFNIMNGRDLLNPLNFLYCLPFLFICSYPEIIGLI